MIRNLLLNYLRSFPIDHGKNKISKYVKLDKTGPVIYTNRYGVKFELNLNEYIQKNLFLFDIYEKNTVRHLLKMVKPGMTFFDVGSNIGTYSVLLAHFLPKGEVFSFEPLTKNFENLQHNITLNNFHNIHAHKLGLSDRHRECEIFYIANESNLGSASLKRKNASQQSETIKMVDLDSFCNEHKIDNIDIMKIDVEGAESTVLKGGEKVIAKQDKMILVMELMDEHLKKFNSSSREIYDYLIAMQFKAYKPSGWPFAIKPLSECPPITYNDNLIFLKGY